MSEPLCVCGEPAEVTVRVEWADGPAKYRYCVECADDVIEFCGGSPDE